MLRKTNTQTGTMWICQRCWFFSLLVRSESWWTVNTRMNFYVLLSLQFPLSWSNFSNNLTTFFTFCSYNSSNTKCSIWKIIMHLDDLKQKLHEVTILFLHDLQLHVLQTCVFLTGSKKCVSVPNISTKHMTTPSFLSTDVSIISDIDITFFCLCWDQTWIYCRYRFSEKFWSNYYFVNPQVKYVLCLFALKLWTPLVYRGPPSKENLGMENMLK